MADHAEATGRDPVSLAINWVLANDAVTSVLIGPKSLTQLETYLRSASADFTDEDEKFLRTLCAPGQTPAPGHGDPRYPLQGRRVS